MDLAALELDLAIHEGEDRVILAEAHVEAGSNWVPRWRMMIEPA